MKHTTLDAEVYAIDSKPTNDSDERSERSRLGRFFSKTGIGIGAGIIYAVISLLAPDKASAADAADCKKEDYILLPNGKSIDDKFICSGDAIYIKKGQTIHEAVVMAAETTYKKGGDLFIQQEEEFLRGLGYNINFRVGRDGEFPVDPKIRGTSQEAGARQPSAPPASAQAVALNDVIKYFKGMKHHNIKDIDVERFNKANEYTVIRKDTTYVPATRWVFHIQRDKKKGIMDVYFDDPTDGVKNPKLVMTLEYNPKGEIYGVHQKGKFDLRMANRLYYVSNWSIRGGHSGADPTLTYDEKRREGYIVTEQVLKRLIEIGVAVGTGMVLSTPAAAGSGAAPYIPSLPAVPPITPPPPIPGN